MATDALNRYYALAAQLAPGDRQIVNFPLGAMTEAEIERACEMVSRILEPRVVKLRVEKVYGNIVMYPACQNAEAFAAIAGTKTLSPSDIDQVKKLGFKIALEDGAAKVLNEILNERLAKVLS